MYVRVILTSALVALATAVPVAAQTVPSPTGRVSSPGPMTTGREVYDAACITCHGADGRGSSRSVVGFEAELPDFTDCAFAAGEADLDWYSVVHEGSPIRGLGHNMPAFGDALSSHEIELAVSHVRTFCADPRWPRGDLNLPRAFFTEKAFPENEAVWALAIAEGGETSFVNDLIYERRLGSRGQVEVKVPFEINERCCGIWSQGLGDVAFAYKQTLHASMRAGRIVAAGAEVSLPSGKDTIGIGNGHSVIETFAMWGQILPENAFVQVHGGYGWPTDEVEGTSEAFVRTSFGATIFADRGFGRAWSPQIEVLFARPGRGPAEWDVVPQLQITLSKLQHVAVAAGVRVPLTLREERHAEGLVYLLWDWYDGGFFDFWK